MKKIIIIITTIVACSTSFAQSDNVYRLKALNFFCQNKNNLLKINNSMLGNANPSFILDLETIEDEDSIFLSISPTAFVTDKTFVQKLLNDLKNNDVIINEEDSYTPSTLKLSEFCGCVFQSMYLGDCSESLDNNFCMREYGLSVSNVIAYDGLKYIVLRISSYFKSKNDKLQFCLIEFSEEGNLLRGGIACIWDVD